MTIEISPTALAAFRKDFQGDVLLPGSPEYEAARTIFNAMIDRHPGIIAQCAGVDDVVHAVNFGRESGLEIAIRGGGHGVAGRATTEGGLVIDLRMMNGVSVDPARGTAAVAGGATMSHFDRATEPFGLVTTGGRVSTTGVAGFTLGGGSGWVERKFGLACDNLISAELVLADGSVARADEKENAELFWALHGGGGNFGVATSLTFRLHKVPAFSMALLLWTPEAAPGVMRNYREYMEGAPEEVGGGLIFLTAPPLPFVPEERVGKLSCAVVLTYIGGEAAARAAFAPMLELGHVGELLTEVPYADLQCMIDDPPGFRNYWSAEHLHTLPDEAIDRFCARAEDMIIPSPSQHIALPLGGAVSRGAKDFPIPWRDAPWVIHPLGLWERAEDDERGKKWARATREDVKPWSTGAVYLNFIGDEGDERVVAGVGRENYARLARVKAEFDPGNLFRMNHNIRPS